MKLFLPLVILLVAGCASNPSASSQVPQIKSFVETEMAQQGRTPQCPEEYTIRYFPTQTSKGWFPHHPLHGYFQMSEYVEPPSAYAYGWQAYRHFVHEVAHSCGVLKENEAEQLARQYWSMVQ